MTWATALAWVLKHWKLIGWLASTGALLFALTVAKGEARHFQKLYTAEKTANDMLAQTYRAASEKARADAEADARAKEKQNAKLKEEADNAYLDRNRIAASYASLSQWMREHAAQDSSGRSDMSGPGTASTVNNGAGGIAAVDEATLQVCTRNTERLLNAHEWGEKFGATTPDTHP